MTEKKIRTRRLKSGDRMAYLDDGTRQVVSRSLEETLDSIDNESREKDAAKTQQRMDLIRDKRDSLSAGDPVPDENRVV